MSEMLFTNPIFYLSILGMIVQFGIAGFLIYFFVKQSKKKKGDK